MTLKFALAAVFCAAAATSTLAEFATARAGLGHAVFLAEASGPSPGSRDSAVLAEAESSGATQGGRDSALAA